MSSSITHGVRERFKRRSHNRFSTLHNPTTSPAVTKGSTITI